METNTKAPEERAPREREQNRDKKPDTESKRPPARETDTRPPAAPKRDAKRKPDTPTKDGEKYKKGWAKPKAKKAKKLKLGDKPSRQSGDGNARTAEKAGYNPLRRKKPKKKSVRIIERPAKPDAASK